MIPKSGGVRLSPADRTVIRRVVLRQPTCRHELRLDFVIGIPLPRTVEVCEFPEAVLAEVPEARRYRFLVRGEEVVVVDPGENRIVDVID